MSNIIKEKKDLLLLRDIINTFNKNELSKEYIEEILKLLIPNKNGNKLIDYNVKAKGQTSAIFSPKSVSINISIDKINEWLQLNSKDLSEMYKIDSLNTLKSFLFLFVITHEIEHSYQYLISRKLIESPSKIITQGYKGIFDILLPENHIIPRPIKETRRTLSILLYKSKENFFILERNANIESTDLLIQLATYIERENMISLFRDIHDTCVKIGYTENTRGSLEETYRKILLYDRYKKFYEETNLTEQEKVRLGLPIKEETREKILKKANKKGY